MEVAAMYGINIERLKMTASGADRAILAISL